MDHVIKFRLRWRNVEAALCPKERKTKINEPTTPQAKVFKYEKKKGFGRPLGTKEGGRRHALKSG
jgi:hypothetical protein